MIGKRTVVEVRLRFETLAIWSAISLFLALFAGGALANDNLEKSAESTKSDESDEEELEEVTVVAHPLSGTGVRAISDIDVVSIERNNLDRTRAENLADVVAAVPGARNASFGPGVSHPVIHGLDGPRILVLYDRLRPMDVATYPGDHPPLVDPFFATQIEVLKGPNTLLFGSGSSGGVINTETGRIVRELLQDPNQYRFEFRTRDNGNRAFGAGRADFNFEDFVFHFDGYSRQADSYDIPGCALSDRMMHHLEEEEMHADEPHEDDHDENECGILPNSDIENRGGSLGLSLVKDWGYAGMSVSSSKAIFGIPVEHVHHEEEHHDDEHEDPHEEGEDEEHEEPHEEEHEEEHGEAERVNIDLDYTRVDWELGLTSPFQLVDELTFRLGVSDYIHDELVEGVAETVFERGDAIDSRLVLTTEEINDWTHAFGGNFNSSEFNFSSEGVASDPITTSSTGIFWLGHTERAEIDYQVGVRLESVTVDFAPVGDKNFTLLNFSGGLARTLQPGLTFDASFDYSSRAPVGDELYVEGLHVAIGSHLEPNPNLDVENIHALNASIEYVEGKLRATITGYMRWADGYIYGTPTGEIEDELPVLQYTQEDASFIGSDIYMDYLLYEEHGWLVESLLSYDFVRAKVDLPGNDSLPRAPADRIRGAIEAHRGSLTLAAMIEYYAEVNDTADNILPTDAYTDVTLDVEYTFDLADRRAKVFLQVKNLLDAERRPHTSPVKDQVPLPGRSLAVGFNIHN